MTEQDRLTKILLEKSCYRYRPCDQECHLCKNVEMADDEAKSIAEHLLANGVVVTPCKIGQLIYRIFPYHKQEIYSWVITEIRILENEIILVDDSGNKIIKIDDIGKTVFLTLEDAEQALEEKKSKDWRRVSGQEI